jgi:hypothetical protein
MFLHLHPIGLFTGVLFVFQENCFFFASVVQEILSARHNGRLISGKLGHKNLARAVRNRIRTKVEELY